MEVTPVLYLGIELTDCRVTMTALSEGFAFLDELLMCMNDYTPVDSWIDSLRINDVEPVSWFFCEKKFIAWCGPYFFFDVARENHKFFLVKDRVVENLYKMCCDLFSHHRQLRDFELSYLLAAARGFIDDAHITPYVGPL